MYRRRSRNKYGNNPVEIMFKGEMTRFDSMKEATRAKELEFMEGSGLITDLQRQVKFEIRPGFYHNGKKIQAETYKADFAYYENGEYVVEDVKGVKTQVYRSKKNWMLYKYGIEIKET